MNAFSKLAALAGIVAITISALTLVSCSSVERTRVAPPAVEGAHFVGNRSCAECHTNIARAFPASAHARFYKDEPRFAAHTGCESCHGPGSRHVELGGGRGRAIVNPGKDASGCFACHLQTEAEFRLPHHHPVTERQMNCVQCHDPHGLDIRKPAAGLFLARGDDGCATCHRQQTRPFVFAHEALREGCAACHNPHGSSNQKLLTQRDSNLCLRCHAQVQGLGSAPGKIYIGSSDHTDYMRRATCWSAGCHSAVHGSNIDRILRY